MSSTQNNAHLNTLLAGTHLTHKHTLLNTIICLSDLYDIFLAHCSVTSLIHLSCTCRHAYWAVKDYKRRAFRVDRIFDRFFTSTLAFRQLQAKTGTIVSGSAALQFFHREFYPESDLDLYVFRVRRFEVGEFLLKEGYKYVPERKQETDFNRAIILPDEGVLYYVHGVLTVFSFKKTNGKGEVVKVQLVVAAHSPMQAILGFHTSKQNPLLEIYEIIVGRFRSSMCYELHIMRRSI